MVSWLIAISLFWTLTAMYLGGAPIHIQGGGGARQTLGLLFHFAVFLGVWWVARLLLGNVVGATLSTVAAAVFAVSLLPLLARLSFRAVGVRITSAEG